MINKNPRPFQIYDNYDPLSIDIIKSCSAVTSVTDTVAVRVTAAEAVVVHYERFSNVHLTVHLENDTF